MSNTPTSTPADSVPADAPHSIEALADLIDPRAAQIAVAGLLAGYQAHPDGWSGADAVELIGCVVPSAVSAAAAGRLPDLDDGSDAVTSYWKGL